VVPSDHAVAVTAEARARQGIPKPEQVEAAVELTKKIDPARDEELPKS
jgi:hypothetical protein